MDVSAAARAVSAARMSSGDHACLGFDDDESRWEIRAAYADIGLSRGEQVMFFTDPATTPVVTAERLRPYGSGVEAAVADGRLVVVNEAPGYEPLIGLDPAERVRVWIEANERARRQGFSGVRIVGDMSWAAGPGVDHDQLVDYEAQLSPLFADIGFTAICEYDRRRFDDGLLHRMHSVHPKRVLHRLGALDVTRTGGVLRIAGDVDLGTREAFVSALELALRGPEPATVLDLSELCFIDGRSASLLVRLAGRLPREECWEVHCRPLLGKLLRLCGATGVPRLVLIER